MAKITGDDIDIFNRPEQRLYVPGPKPKRTRKKTEKNVWITMERRGKLSSMNE
jgi:hypothetical protein